MYHFNTSDQREKPVYKCHIAHVSVRYRKYRTLGCADISLVHCYNALMQEMKLPLYLQSYMYISTM